MDDPLIYWVDLNSLNPLVDFESPQEDGNYTVKLTVFDEEGSFEDFLFYF